MTLDELNLLSRTEAALAFSRCCGSAQWARTMALRRPYQDKDELLKTADAVWRRLSAGDWKEAFSAHTEIGESPTQAGETDFTGAWVASEQNGTRTAPEQTVRALAAAGAEYEKKFGYTFVAAATGMASEELLTLLKQRLQNDPGEEIRIASEEQRKITSLRLQKLIGSIQP